jgi:hypothetical protein
LKVDRYWGRLLKEMGARNAIMTEQELKEKWHAYGSPIAARRDAWDSAGTIRET